MSENSFEECLNNVGRRIAEQVGYDQKAIIQAVHLVWDGIYDSGATMNPDAPPRPVSPQDYLQGIQEGYIEGKKDGREEVIINGSHENTQARVLGLP